MQNTALLSAEAVPEELRPAVARVAGWKSFVHERWNVLVCSHGPFVTEDDYYVSVVNLYALRWPDMDEEFLSFSPYEAIDLQDRKPVVLSEAAYFVLEEERIALVLLNGRACAAFAAHYGYLDVMLDHNVEVGKHQAAEDAERRRFSVRYAEEQKETRLALMSALGA